MVENVIIYDDLALGRVYRITAGQLAPLLGKSAATLARYRCHGTSPIPFQRDEGGRIYYLAADVLAFLNKLSKERHQSTSEYDEVKGARVDNVAKARDVQATRKRMQGKVEQRHQGNEYK